MANMTAVVAMAENRIIGDGKGLIWNLPNDLKRVKRLTMRCPLIMGRKTWDSIGRPLPGRASIVMTRNKSWTADGAIVAENIEVAILAAQKWIENTAESRSEIILFGGGEIYQQGLEYCQSVERTVVDETPDGGAEAAYFPKLPAADWIVEIEAKFSATDESPAYRFERAIRRTLASQF